MIDAFVLFLSGIFLSWPAFIVLCVLGILFEHNDARGWAVFTTLITGLVAYLFFSVSMRDLAVIAVVYLVVGFVWSFWRYRRFVRTKVAELKYTYGSTAAESSDFKRKVRQLHPKEHTDTIVAWIIVWPFSAVDNIVGDVLSILQTFVTVAFKQAYQAIYKSAVKGLIDEE